MFRHGVPCSRNCGNIYFQSLVVFFFSYFCAGNRERQGHVWLTETCWRNYFWLSNETHHFFWDEVGLDGFFFSKHRRKRRVGIGQYGESISPPPPDHPPSPPPWTLTNSHDLFFVFHSQNSKISTSYSYCGGTLFSVPRSNLRQLNIKYNLRSNGASEPHG